MDDSRIEELIEEIYIYAKKNLKEKRFEHSVRVAETAQKLCSIFGYSQRKGYLAGLAHDICKNMEDEELVKLVSKTGYEISDIEKNKLSLLHGKAASILIQEKFSIDDSDVIEAVSKHTFGGTGLCPLAKIIYVADKIEPGRPQSTNEYRENLYSMSLNKMTLAVVEENMEYLKSRNKKIAKSSFEFESDLKKLVAMEG